jgi:integrase
VAGGLLARSRTAEHLRPLREAVRVHIKPVLGRLKLTTLAPSHLAGFYLDKLAAGFAPASVNKLHMALHKALDQAVK